LDLLYARGDVLFLAAAGNDGTDAISYPAGYTSVISVAATNVLNQRAGFSQANADVELAAPGVATLSTLVNGSAMSGPNMETSPPVYGDPGDDNLQSPPPSAFDGSGRGIATGGCSTRHNAFVPGCCAVSL
jgi:subtilisin family serine protease